VIAAALYAAVYVLQLAVVMRAVLRPNRGPTSRLAWVVVILILPGIGLVAYLFFGETSIGRGRVARSREVVAALKATARGGVLAGQGDRSPLPLNVEAVFRLGESVNGFEPVCGNRGRLTADSNHAIDDMVADMDAARDHIHLAFYIWLDDNSGLKVVEALKRAAGRGVTCRAMADGLGSRTMVASPHWRAMGEAGVYLGVALPIGNPLLRPFRGRIDLRNHRKIVVIDSAITYCGSQNCADPEFRVKAKYAPWVDAMMRFEGPIVLQNQFLFASDWMACVDEDLNALLTAPPPPAEPGFPAQVIATGPTVRPSAMPEVFASLMFAASKRLTITTPYYVPNDLMQAALCAAANRGVETTIIFPFRNDSFIVAAASRSNYEELLGAGVRIFEYQGGLLHTKSMIVDDALTLIGSANMDQRSFDLNYENNILFYDLALTAQMRERQETYLAASRPVNLEEVRRWSVGQRLWNNGMAMLGPLL
jgi:cardiolipin synthase